MPTYNRAMLIAETIRSVQDQTYTNWELLIIDDGSVDDTSQVVEKIKDERIFFHRAGRTAIVGRLKNTALRQAKGNLIAFIDSDDLWHPSKLQKQIDALMQFPGAGFCLVNGYNFQHAGQPMEYFYKQKDGIKEGNVFLGCFQSQVAGYTQALLVRKECIAVAGGFKEDKAFSDFEFIISLAYHFNAVILYEPLVFRRIHQNNYSNSTWAENMKEGIAIIRNHRHLIPRSIAGGSLFRLYIDFGEKYLEQKQYWKAFRQFNKAWINKPLTVVPPKKMAKTFLNFLKRS